MAHTLARNWAEVVRLGRLVRRHLRHGRASFAGAPSAAKDRDLSTLFRTVNTFLRDLGGEYLIVCGTLLGWHRHRGLLPHDKDVDFGLPEAAYPLVRASGDRLPAGFILHDTSHRHGGPKLYVEYRGWEADLYFYAEKDGKLLPYVVSDEPGDAVPFPRDWFFPRQPATFLGEATFVPAQPEKYLEHQYGYFGADAERDPVTRYYRRRSP